MQVCTKRAKTQPAAYSVLRLQMAPFLWYSTYVLFYHLFDKETACANCAACPPHPYSACAAPLARRAADAFTALPLLNWSDMLLLALNHRALYTQHCPAGRVDSVRSRLCPAWRADHAWQQQRNTRRGNPGGGIRLRAAPRTVRPVRRHARGAAVLGKGAGLASAPGGVRVVLPRAAAPSG